MTLNFVSKATLAAIMIVGLGACGKKKGGSSAGAAATPSQMTCPATGVNPYDNQAYCQPGTTVYPTGQGQGQSMTCPPTGQNPYTGGYCQPGQVIYANNGQGGQTVCPATGQNPYTGGYCQPGQVIYVGQQPGYPGQGQYPQDGCSQWSAMYGVPYYPAMYQGQLVCMRAY